ncbi:MAG: TMEM175 family protein [Candidatus Kapabacteria bacterium]|nr:TMEM175 family protein [Candidatus Kapabacteria bacterium]
MNKNRLEAFSDGVLAIIITIMVLEFKIPHGSEWSVLIPLIPKFIGYGLSFAYVGIYWGNHHHMLHTVKQVSSKMLLSNLNFLFWLSLVPFATAWMSENEFTPNTTALYGVLLLLCNISFTILQKSTLKYIHDIDQLNNAFKMINKKGIISTSFYIVSLPIAFVQPYVSFGIYLCIAIMWLVPDKNIEYALKVKH